MRIGKWQAQPSGSEPDKPASSTAQRAVCGQRAATRQPRACWQARGQSAPLCRLH